MPPNVRTKKQRKDKTKNLIESTISTLDNYETRLRKGKVCGLHSKEFQIE